MAISRGDQERRLLPRWKGKRSTVDSAELGGTGKVIPIAPPEDLDLSNKLATWRETGALADAVDAVSAAIFSGFPGDAQDALEALRNRDAKRPALRALAFSATSDVPNQSDLAISDSVADLQHDLRLQVRTLRTLVATYPRNPFLWSSLSRAHLTMGYAEKAEHAMSVALFLAPHSRYVVRSAVRLYTHLRKYGRALHLLHHFEGLKSDPWILSAEIAVTSIRGNSSRFIKAARVLAADNNFSPINRSELNGSLATLELYSGNTKASRKYFAASLEHPTDNSAAQAVWASTSRSVVVPVTAGQVALSSEAEALQMRANQQWEGALMKYKAWLSDEPFSRRPAVDGSYLAAVAIGDLTLAQQFIEAGLQANPKSAMLRNNYVVTLAQQGRLDEAAAQLAKLAQGGDEAIPKETSLATLGLILFRLGNVEEGREQYRSALRLAQRSGEARHVALAALHLALEEQRLNSDHAPAAIAFARDAVARTKAAEVTAMLKRTLGEK